MADFKVLTLNIGGSTTIAGLLSILRLDNPHLVMIQEVTLSSEQLCVQVSKFGYKAATNIDMTNPSALGTGLIWQSHLPVSDIYSVVECRAQALKLGQYAFINIYAPSGSQNRQSRREFFGQDIFRFIRSFSNHSLPIIAGDFNSILSQRDTERNFSDKTCPARICRTISTILMLTGCFNLKVFLTPSLGQTVLLLAWTDSIFLSIWLEVSSLYLSKLLWVIIMESIC